MSFEMDCVKHCVLGGRVEDLPTDLAFILERNYSSVINFLNGVWENPRPCNFVWCSPRQLERIVATDSLLLPLEKLKIDTYEGKDFILIRVTGWTFDHLRISERVSINGETGWLLEHISNEPIDPPTHK